MLFGQTMINGLLTGGVYALIAVGLTMIFGVMKIVNFAQSEFLMIGMYMTLMLFNGFASLTTPYLLIFPVAAIMFVFGMIVFKLVVRPVLGKGDTSYILLTVGLSYFLQNIAQVIWGANPLSIDTPIKNEAISIAGLTIITPRIIAFAIALIFMLLVNYFLSKTDTGRAMRATSESTQVAAMLGINAEKMFIIAFGIGAMLSAVAGCIISPIYSIYPRVGTVFSTTIYACVVIGGLGNIKGAFFGGLIIGLIEAFSGTYLALNLAPTSVFLMLLLFMLFKPQGMFGKGARVA